MSAQARSCNELPIEMLLVESGGNKDITGQYLEMTEHVGTCLTCQKRLSNLAADDGFWSDAQSLLSDAPEYEWKPDATWSALLTPADVARPRAAESAALERLGTPRHPEMLGRLGRYDIERVIGSGGMGIVLKAHDSELNRPIAIKLLAPHLAHVGAARERFAREGRAAAAVVHEHVVSIYNVETDGETPFLVMKYVPGRSLQSRVDADGPLAVKEILRVGMQAAAGLAAAHAQGLVHRDVKPSNILLEETVERVVLTDFGLARAVDDASLTQTGVLAGTPHYMSPEQAIGAPIDHRSDLFGLGAVLYFMASGHPPFRADGAMAVLHRICREPHRPIWHHNLDVPDELSDVIDRLLEKKPGRRFASAEEVGSRLAAILSSVQRYGYRKRRFVRLRRHSIGLLAARGAVGLLLGAVVVGAVAGIPRLWQRTAADVPVRTETSSPGTAADTASVGVPDGRFLADFTDAQRAVIDSERPAIFLRGGHDPWRREVEMLKHELNQLESTQ